MDAKRHSSTLESALAAELAAFEPGMRVGDLLVALPTAVWAKDLNGRYVFANPAYMDFFEVPPETVLVGSTDYDFFNAEDAASFQSADRRVVTSGVAEHHYEAVHLANKLGQSFTETSQSYAKFAASALQAGLSTEKVQAAFKACHGLQCGFCTPGMVMSAVDLVQRHGCHSETQVREGLEGNICRCTGYHNIVKAVQQGAAAMKA